MSSRECGASDEVQAIDPTIGDRREEVRYQVVALHLFGRYTELES